LAFVLSNGRLPNLASSKFPSIDQVKRGLLAEGTMGQIRDRVAQMLVQNGLDKCRARDIVEKAAQHSSAATTSAARVRQICNLEALFRQLKGRGIKIAVCTADSRYKLADRC
jgi:hypothetical protein